MHLTAAAVAALSLALVAPAATAAPPQPAPLPTPEFTDVEVHDPSHVEADGEHWVFGSHLAAASTEDFMTWEQEANHVTAENPLFGDVTVELAETFAWAESDTLWAPDVIQLADGRYYMYYNACRGDSPRSAMGVAVSDDVGGPYRDLGIILRSGHRDGEGMSADGTPYDGSIHPNAVDPDVFYDHEGDLWMTYGSYSGGIFSLELDPETGMPLPDQGYGTHLTGGNHSRIEGASIMPDAESGDYFMFLSFGGLDSDGGYNMRVARADSPAGPYYDAEGNDMREVRSDPDLPIFDDASIEPYGTKLMGSYLFQREVGDPGSGIGDGYVSPGHNTTYVDPETGEMLLIFHSRFPGQGERHNVRANRMHFNSAGWPVVAPYRYAGAGLEHVRRGDAVGRYRLIDHGKAITADVARAEDLRLNQNGTVSGAVTGRWQVYNKDRAKLTLDGEVYDGRFSREWDPTAQAWVQAFSVQSAAGVSLWGSALAPMSDAEIVAAVSADLAGGDYLGDTSAVVADLQLPTEGTHGSNIAWESSDPSVVTAEGAVTRPAPGDDDGAATLTATVASGGLTERVEFDVTVLAKVEQGLAAHYSFDGSLEEAESRTAEGTVTGHRIDTTGGQVSYTGGVDGQAAVLDGASGIRLPDGVLSGKEYSVSLWLNPEQFTPYTTAFFGARDENNWISLVPQGHSGVGGNTLLWSGATTYYDGDAGSRIPAGQWSHMAFTVDHGDVAVYLDGELVHAGSGFPDVLTTADGVFGVGVNWWDTPFAGAVDDLRLYTGALDAADVAALAKR
ncbi:LamG-like jellyroll fold domain-containing protein [Zhihengliuella halotolerans]|uniref:Arabinan endo-1,5-alpha-L-arabinosidase n=1 Tax=Zhihengliuella halotolerans TaxID=370736 RepID=A0A4Q8AAA6_9MICC|nr:LamG-like jellyroll fold domain-containing protein [Zhihengliuella halotolerans]RZU60988.1 arabinan endo-1,5-alpha-L-arabinosidase [Zhihengliuella halotolerans]